jgi:sortase A
MNSLFNNRRPRRWRASHIIEFVFLLAGLSGIGWFVFSIADTKIYQSYENYRFEAGLRGERATLRGYIADLFGGAADDSRTQSSEEAAPQPPPPDKRPPMARGSTVGRIEIPRIKVSALVREGSDDKTLKRAAGHVPYTSLPGEHGNVGIAAHRDTFFRNVRNIREGDIIRMKTTWGTYEYEVDSLKIVMPENVEVLNPTPAPSITLVTCYPFNYVGSAPKRFIVRARQINPPVDEKMERSAGLRKASEASGGAKL